MSIIKRALKQEKGNTEIEKFLLSEGFKFGSGAQGEGSMRYISRGKAYAVWFALCENHISLYAEYDCGGKVGSAKFSFRRKDFNNFLIAYNSSIEWAKDYID